MNLKTTLTVVFGSSTVLANILAAKLITVPIPVMGAVAVPAGFIAFGLAFLASDLLVEYFGESEAADVLWATVGMLLLAYGLIWVAIAMPSAVFYDATAFDRVLGASAAVSIASVITIALSQRFDVWLFARLREWTDGRHRWIRNCVSTGTSQAVDTVVFITLAFAVFPWLQGGSPLLGMALATTIVGQYLAKLVVAAADTPVFYLVTEVVGGDA